MSNINIEELLSIFSGCEISGDKIILKDGLHEALKYVTSTYTFNSLKDIQAIDRNEKGIELVYRLYSQADEEDLLISIFVKDEAESIIDIFKSAIADENEIYDMFGIKFVGNENLKRLYMPESWEGHPLKKDYAEDDSRLAWNDNSNNA